MNRTRDARSALPLLALLGLFTFAPGFSRADAPVGGPSEPATQPTPADTLYHDPTATSSASVTQLLPNSTQPLQTFTNVERITLRNDVFIIYWAQGAVTLLPKQFVTGITINRRTPHPTPDH